eukprot:3936149-Rhodomonas_salina.2
MSYSFSSPDAQELTTFAPSSTMSRQPSSAFNSCGRSSERSVGPSSSFGRSERSAVLKSWSARTVSSHRSDAFRSRSAPCSAVRVSGLEGLRAVLLAPSVVIAPMPSVPGSRRWLVLNPKAWTLMHCVDQFEPADVRPCVEHIIQQGPRRVDSGWSPNPGAIFVVKTARDTGGCW